MLREILFSPPLIILCAIFIVTALCTIYEIYARLMAKRERLRFREIIAGINNSFTKTDGIVLITKKKESSKPNKEEYYIVDEKSNEIIAIAEQNPLESYSAYLAVPLGLKIYNATDGKVLATAECEWFKRSRRQFIVFCGGEIRYEIFDDKGLKLIGLKSHERTFGSMLSISGNICFTHKSRYCKEHLCVFMDKDGDFLFTSENVSEGYKPYPFVWINFGKQSFTFSGMDLEKINKPTNLCLRLGISAKCSPNSNLFKAILALPFCIEASKHSEFTKWKLELRMSAG